MELYKTIKQFFEKKISYWYIIVAIFAVVGIGNYAFLKMAVPMWVCDLIALLLVVLFTVYVSIVSKYLCNRYRSLMSSRKEQLFCRIETLQKHIDELNDKNIELENKLAEALHSSISESADKTISELTSQVSIASTDIQNRIQMFDDKLEDRLDRDVNELYTRMDESFAIHKKTVDEGIKDIKSQVDSSTEVIKNIINENHKENYIKSTEIIETLNNKTVEVTNTINDVKTDADRQRNEQNNLMRESTAEICEAVKTAHREESEAISSAQEKIIANAAENRTAAESFANENKKVQDEANAQLESKVEETAGKTALLLSGISELISKTHSESNSAMADAQEKIIANAAENREAAESLANENKRVQDEANVQIESKVKETAEKTALLLAEISELISRTHRENNEAISSAQEKIIANAAENRGAAESLANENKRVQDEANVQIENRITAAVADATLMKNELEKTLYDIRENLLSGKDYITVTLSDKLEEKAISDDQVYDEIKAQLRGVEENIIENENENTEQVKELIKKTDAEEKEYINSSTEKIVELTEQAAQEQNNQVKSVRDTLINELGIISGSVDESRETISREIFDMKDGVREDISKIIEQNEESRSDVTNISDRLCEMEMMQKNSTDEHTGRLVSLEDKLYEMETMQKNSTDEHTGRLVSLEDKFEMLNELLDNKVEELGEKTSQMQSELANIMSGILSSQEESSEKTRNAHERISTQISEFSKETKSQIEKLAALVDEQQEFIEIIEKSESTLAQKQLMQISEIKDKLEINSDREKQYQSEFASRLDNIQTQIINLNSLAKVLKNMSVVQETVKQELPKQKAIDPNRTEEIKDEEAGITVRNHYKNGYLATSELISGKKKTYDAEYDMNGRMMKSRNYAENGEVTTELEFHPNGQIKSRKEKLKKNGKMETVITKFDERGNKEK